MRDPDVEAQLTHIRQQRSAQNMDTTEPVPADPINPTVPQKEPAWLRYVIALVASVIVWAGSRFLDVDADAQTIVDLLTPVVAYAIATWSTRGKVYSPATVAKIVSWQTTGHEGEVVTKAKAARRPEPPADLS